MRLVDADALIKDINSRMFTSDMTTTLAVGMATAWLENAPTIEVKPEWISVEKGLPEERDWYLGIFKEPDTGWINTVPFICDYLLGTKTKATTKEGWILKGFTDREEYIDYYFNLECVAWCHLPEPYMDLKYFI